MSEPTAPVPPPKAPPRRRSWAKRALLALLALLVLALLVVLAGVGAVAYLNSGAGNERIRQAARDALQGDLAIGQVSLQGNRLVLRDLVLKDPEGNVVAEIQELTARISLPALARGHVVLKEARIQTPRLYLKQDERGLNLSRALAARHPKPEAEKPEARTKSSLVLRLDGLTLANGYVEFTQETGEAPRRFRVEELSAQGSASFHGPKETLAATLHLTGTWAEPLKGPLTLELEGGQDPGNTRATVKLDAPGAQVDATAVLSGKRDVTANLRALRVDPETARAFLPTYPLIKPVSLTGKASLKDDLAQADLLLTAGSGKLTVKGTADVAKQRTDGLAVTARDVNLAELVQDGPKTTLALDFNARGGGTTLENLDGEVHLLMPAAKVEGEPLGPVRLDATAKAGSFHLSHLLARLPGLSLTGGGSGDLHALSISGTLNATDLGLLARTAGRLTGQTVPEVSGSGTLDFALKGPPTHPALSLTGAFDSLLYGKDSVSGLSLSANLADVRKPLEAQADLKAAVLNVLDRHFKDVAATLTTRGRDVEADLSAKGLADLVLHVGGTLEKSEDSFLLSSLGLRYPEAEWTLQAPARISFGGALGTEPIALAAGPQRVTAVGSKQGARLQAALDVEKLDLKLLPRTFVDPELGLAGEVDAHVRAQGTAARPEVDAKLAVRGGAYRQYKDLGLGLDARYAKDRAQGKLSATSQLASVDADFDVPVQAVLKKRPEPLRVTLDVHELELSRLLAKLGRAEKAGGRMQAQLVVTGTARDPLVRAWVRGRGMSAEKLPALVKQPDFDLVVESGPEAKLDARLLLESAGGSATVAVRTPYTAAALLQKQPTREELLSAPLELDLDARDLNLQLLHALDVGPELKGRLTARLEARGSARAPTANATARVEGLSTATLPPTALELGLVASRERVDVSLDADRPGLALARLTAGVGAPLATLMDEAALPALPFTVDGTIGPVATSELRLITTDPEEVADLAERRAKQVTAVVNARLSGGGTLGAPKLSLTARADEIRVGSDCVGGAVMEYRYADAKSLLEAALRSQGNGSLALHGSLGLDLSYPGVKQGLETDGAPLTATLQARGFDLAIFSGLVPKTRELAGKLRADATLGGTLGAPSWKADAEWLNGRVATTGYGEYKQVHLALKADNDLIKLEDLSASSGGGTAKLSFEAKRVEERFVVNGRTNFDRFPIVSDDQLEAVVKMAPTIQGEVTGDVYALQVNLPRADIELPEIQRKDLQDLDRPEDVLLVRGGTFLDKKRVKKLAEKRQERAGTPAPAAKPATATAAKPVTAPKPGAAVAAEDEEASGSQYRIIVNAPRDIVVRGTDINAEVGLSEGFRVEYVGATSLLGDVSFVSGRVDALGRKFTIQKGSTVHFSGPAKKPYVYLTAIHVNEREQVTVKITVRGEGKDISFKPTSEPPLSESEIYTLLATGRRTLKQGSGAAMSGADAASIVGSLAAAQLKKTLASKVPLDVLRIEAGEEGVAGTRVEAGTYVTDKIYVGYTGRLGANPQKENSNAVRIEYQITPRISAEGECGDARVCGADLIWSWDY